MPDLHQKFKILLAEDDDISAMLIMVFLKKAGIQDVTRVYNGLDALDYLRNDSSYDLLISDALMPGMNGFELLAKIQENLISVPVIIVTGKKDDEDKVRAMQGGAIDYITKPFNPNELIVRLQIVLKKIQKLKLN